jgi:hypothetical protein
VVTVEVANGNAGGSITFWTAGEPIPPSPAFALAPDQRRSSTEWFNPALGPVAVIRAPEGAVLRIWTLGGYT